MLIATAIVAYRLDVEMGFMLSIRNWSKILINRSIVLVSAMIQHQNGIKIKPIRKRTLKWYR